MVHRSSLVAAALIACAGCGEAPDPARTGVVMLDREAQGTWALAQQGWEGTPRLPVALSVEEPVVLSSFTRTSELHLAPGMLTIVRGASGEIDQLLIGAEIRGDALVVHGSDPAVAELGKQLGGEVKARGDGLYRVVVPDVFERTSFLEPPEGILEVLPDFGPDPALDLEGGIPRSASLGSVSAGVVDPVKAAELARREARLVGVYGAGNTSLLLDASGQFSFEDECSGNVKQKGRYRLSGDRVLLAPDVGAPLALLRDGERLLDPRGARFAPILDDAEPLRVQP